MAIRLIVEVLDTPLTLTHRERCLLVALAEDANDDTALTWSSIQDPKILRRADLSRTQLYAVVKELLAKGAIEKVTAGQRHAIAKYRIHPQGSVARDTDEPQSPVGRDAIGRFSVPCDGTLNTSQCPAGRDFSVPLDGTPTPLPLKRDISPAPRTPAEPDRFDEFWAAYPKKVGKGTARTAWTKALKRGADPAAIVAAVPQHAAFWRAAGTDPKFIPHPTTWLNGERYDDELTDPRPAAQQPQHQTYADRGIY